MRKYLAGLFDVIDWPEVHAWLERAVVIAAAVGFIVHLATIGVARVR